MKAQGNNEIPKRYELRITGGGELTRVFELLKAALPDLAKIKEPWAQELILALLGDLQIKAEAFPLE
jgi:hypothetical protein